MTTGRGRFGLAKKTEIVRKLAEKGENARAPNE
jgi:hypothetical protein